MTTKTNPAYAALAYRKAILHHLSYHLQRNCLAAPGVEPKEKVISEDVFTIDSEVPFAEIESFLEGLIDEEEKIRLEMAKFEFTRKHNDEQEPQGAKSQKGVRKKSSQGSGEGDGSPVAS